MGQEKYNGLTPFYYKDADIVMLIFDKSSIDSFNRIIEFYNSVKQLSVKNPFIAVVCNKCDLEDLEQTINSAHDFKKQNKLFYH